jgi:hypothetical protein
MLKVAFGEQTVGRTQAFDWFSKFKSGLISVKDADHSGHPMASKTDENMDKVKELVFENRKITIHEVANMLAISFGSVQSNLKDNLPVHHTAMKFVSCTCSLWFVCVSISVYKQNYSDSTASIVTRFSAV